jgi:hypothetical protein
MLLAAFIVLTLCFFVLIALICAAPEGWQDSEGFHTGRPTLDQLRRDLPMPCRSCGIGPCVCGEFDTLHHARSNEAERLEAAAAVVSPLHSATDTSKGQRHHGR